MTGRWYIDIINTSNSIRHSLFPSLRFQFLEVPVRYLPDLGAGHRIDELEVLRNGESRELLPAVCYHLLDELVVPDDRILIETDSPFLAPVPLRGTPNEPAFIVHTCEFLAKLRGKSADDFAELTFANAERILG